MKSVRAYLKESLLARNTLWMLLGLGGRIVVQALYFVVIARSLGVKGYGAFVGVVGLVAVLAPFASLGSGNLLIKNVARGSSLFGRHWGGALTVTGLSSAFLVCLVLLLSHAFLPAQISLLLVLEVAIADIIFARLQDLSGQAYQAFERLGRTAQLQIILSFLRLGAALLLRTCYKSPTPEQWGKFYLISTAISAIIGTTMVNRELGFPRFNFSYRFSDLREGSYFSVSLSAQSIYNDIDKTMLARLSTLEAAGIYGAAYRLINVAYMPLMSLWYASYTKFFQHGASGVKGSLSFARRLFPFGSAYGLLAGFGLYFSAPILPRLLGEDYAYSVEVIRWLAVIPLLKAFQICAANTLTGADYQGVRSSAQLGVAVFNVCLNFWLIPLYSWRGAAWASMATDSLMALVLWVLVWSMYARERRAKTQPALFSLGDR